jgi:ABC-type methionine transport system ATPase subunit
MSNETRKRRPAGPGKGPSTKATSAKSAKPVKASKGSKAAKSVAESRRFWLTYPGKLITRPVIWELSQKFPVVFNVRQASVTDALGILCLELTGPRADIKEAIRWLEKQGVTVEPVEINVIES